MCPACYGFYVLWQGEPNFRAYFFVEGRNAVDDFTNSDTYDEPQDLVYNQLEVAGRGSRSDISIEFSVEDRSMYLAK